MIVSAAEGRACGRCGRLFTPKRSDARYCSDACRWAGNRANRAVRTDSTVTARITPESRVPAAVTTLAPPAWEPPSEPSEPVPVSEICPACGESLRTTGRGTRRACLACKHSVIPGGVRAPYERGTAAVRQVRSQRELDLQALALARRKGIMLDQIARLADDERLHPESRPVVEWFAGQVRAAETEARLGELVTLLPEAGIRRRHWWQGSLAEPVLGDDDDDGQGDDDDDGDRGELEASQPRELTSGPAAGHVAELAVRGYAGDPAAPPGRPGVSRPMTWADALARLGWRLVPRASGCEISEGGPACDGEAARSVGDGWACGRHYETLAVMITKSQR